jgi:predicted MPP superfamily phosphohydrolase
MHSLAAWCAAAVALVGHGFVWTSIVNRLHGLRGPRLVIKTLTWVCIAAFAVLPCAAVAWMWQRGVGPQLLFPTGWPQPAATIYAWGCAAIGAASLVIKPWIESRRHDARVVAAWTTDVRDVARAMGCRPMVGAMARLLDRVPVNEQLTLAVERKRLVVPRLPAELAGLTIAHVSDLHMTGRVGREFYDYATRVVNDLRPDVIAITGDIVETEACWPWLADTVGSLCAPLGVYFILGNHDVFIDGKRTHAMLTEAGLTCLSGRWQRAEWNGATVVLGGNEMPWMSAAPQQRTQARPDAAEEFRIALCHSPDQFGWCVNADIDLAMAGHTHGGQVQLPWLGVIGTPSLHGTRYVCGVFRRGNTVLHVTRGLSGQTPLRWRCRPEIALLELSTPERPPRG